MDFNAIRLKLASPESILKWSHGEVLKPETINYRTQRPEKEGLFSEVIFGPEKDYQCYCGKYKKPRFKGIICDKCGVEVTHSSVRRERMGHIKLACPVAHIWFLRKLPSKIALTLNVSLNDIEKVVYFASYIVTKVNEDARRERIKDIEKEFVEAQKKAELWGKKLEELSPDKLQKLRLLQEKKRQTLEQLNSLKPLLILSEADYRLYSQLYPSVFEAGIGAETLRKIFEEIDLYELKQNLEAEIKKAPEFQRKKLIQRLSLIKGFIKAGIRPEWMFITVLPVIPPDLRPMVQLDGGRFASSDVNDLYRRVINRNNRLKRLIELKAPEVILRNEKRMLQEAVDALIDNSARKTKTVMSTTGQPRPLKSLADMLRGKQGRFRRNLLGKRVDYSGRSVIVVGPELKLNECGLPKKIALEIFKPFIIQNLIKRGLAHNVRGAGHLIEAGIPEVWDILEEVTKNNLVLLNRAPTLHRLGIQAFQPILIEGLAIRLHPLVCPAFNADFDGDQMAVHLPLSEEAQNEARNLMIAHYNLLKPSTGKPIVNPNQDMVLGIYWLTELSPATPVAPKYFNDEQEAIFAWQSGKIDLREPITVYKLKHLTEPTLTSVGRILFNSVLPAEIEFINKQLNKSALSDIVGKVIEKCDNNTIREALDNIKDLGFTYSTYSGITWSMDDLKVPPEKVAILNESEKEAANIEKFYQEGGMTKEEKKDNIIRIWERAKEKIADFVKPTLKNSPSIYSIIDSGSRGSWGQVVQMVGMKGLVANPSNEIIELPVKSSFKEGFNVLEYFISTHGARKGTTDTALRTAAAGYLTRRLIDVAHDVIVNKEDCQTKNGLVVYRADCEEMGQSFADRLYGRVCLNDVTLDNKVIIKAGEIINKNTALKIEASSINEIKIRSPITCENRIGVCQKCYGWDLSKNTLVALGEAVGIVAAQSIGEPGTQLTMRTFHMGGVAGSSDITQGLPRVEEIFEVRHPKTKAIISTVNGIVANIIEKENLKTIKVEITDPNSKQDYINYNIPAHLVLWVNKGDRVFKGQQLTEGHIDIVELYNVTGFEYTCRYILIQVQKIYTSKGADINDKHIEIIIRKLLSRVKVLDPGDTDLLPGKIVEKIVFENENERVKRLGLKTATAESLILGISKVAMTTNSFLSAASFQTTAQALIDASVEGKIDQLLGLKENVIIGRLIPAGTGFQKKD
ncbi:MAG: DNA-directed RNA polymerase subunit beta' [candidate division WOR-3 bacterium]